MLVIPPLRLSLLGDFLLVSGETPVTTVTVPRLQSLLAYLVLHRNAPQDRSHLAFLLWPDSTEAQAHTNLRKLLHQLRQVLPDVDKYLQVDRHTLHWPECGDETSWRLDVMVFEAALERAVQAGRRGELEGERGQRRALEQAVDFYRGDLL